MTLRKYIATLIGIVTLTVIGATLASEDGGGGAAVCITGIIALGILNIFDTVWTTKAELK